MSLHPTLYILLATLLLGGCHQQTAAVASAPAPVSTSSNADAGSGASVGQDGIPQLQREALLPLAAYIADPASPQEPNAAETRISEHFRQMYWSAAKRDDTLLAVDFIAGFPKVQDSFQRTDLIRSNRTLLDAAFADARANKHFSIYHRKAAPLQLQHYDDKERVSLFSWTGPRTASCTSPNRTRRAYSATAGDCWCSAVACLPRKRRSQPYSGRPVKTLRATLKAGWQRSAILTARRCHYRQSCSAIRSPPSTPLIARRCVRSVPRIWAAASPFGTRKPLSCSVCHTPKRPMHVSCNHRRKKWTTNVK